MLKYLPILLISSVALAETALPPVVAPSMEARMFAVCQDQQRAMLTWHAGAAAQQAALAEEVERLSKQILELRAKLKDQ